MVMTTFPGVAKRTYSNVQGRGISYNLWPVATGVPATGTVVLSGAGAWGLIVDLVAAAAIALDYWLCGFYFNTVAGGAVQVMEVIASSTGNAAGGAGPPTAPLYYGARIDPTAVTTNIGLQRVPYPVFIAGGTRLCMSIGGAAARSFATTVLYALGL